MQEEIIKKWAKEGHSFEEIQTELQRQFGLHAYKRTTIYKYMQEVKLGCSQKEDSSFKEKRIDEQLLIRIQQEINKNQFFSVRSLAQKLNVNQNIIYNYLTKELHYVYKHSRWVPHSLNSSQKKKRMEQSMELFQVLNKSKHNNYRDIITGDQSWFFYNNSPKGRWVLEDEEAPTYPNTKVFTDKMMITVIWGVYGTYILDALPEGEYLNSKYFIEHILKPLEAQEHEIWPKRGKHKIWLHVDNCRVHNSQDTQTEILNSIFKRAPHPPYSPDLAPSDFYLFGYVKGKLKGRSFNSRDAVHDAIVDIIEAIPFKTRKKVFDEWAHRCQWVASHEGSYYLK